MTIIESHEGTYRDYRWTIRWKELTSMTEKYGDVVLSIFDDSYGIYTERHTSDETPLSELKDRARDIISRIHDDENVGRCDACGGLYNRKADNQLYEQEFSWADRHIFTHGMDPRYKSAETNEQTRTCVWTTGRIFDTVHVVTHLRDTNPFYDDEELVNTDSLVMCRGFERVHEDGEVRPFEELQEKYLELKRKTPSGRSARERQKELLELLDWVLQREDRFYTDNRFKPRHLR